MSNLDAVRPLPVSITLDKERHLLYDFNALASLEDAGYTITEAMEQIGKGSAKAIRAFLWAGLLHEEPSLTLEAVGKMITLQNLAYVAEQIGKAQEVALQDDSAKNVVPPAEPKLPEV
jgi:DNA-binding phage protein